MKPQSKKIVHVCQLDKFIPPFIDLVEEHFSDFATRHDFYIAGDRVRYPYKARNNIVHADAGKKGLLKHLIALAKAIHRSEKVILHGLFYSRYLLLLSCMPWVHKKCYWVIWGGDLYAYQKAFTFKDSRWDESLRRFVIPRIGHFITHIKGDYELVKEWYGAKGEWHECFMYPSNLYQELPAPRTPHKGINILVGNSADPSNNHVEVLNQLLRHRDEGIHIFVPLSYGDRGHAKRVAAYGKERFGEKFTALTEFMSYGDYLKLLNTIDIAIFNHKRQQAMGVTTALLGLGKKVYMRQDLPSSKFFEECGVKTHDNRCIELETESAENAKINVAAIRKYFSRERLVSMQASIFSDSA